MTFFPQDLDLNFYDSSLEENLKAWEELGGI
jgi:hypothetical protein